MGCFNDLPKDVVWLVLRQTFVSQRLDEATIGGHVASLWTLTQLEKENLSLMGYYRSYCYMMCNFALINQRCLNIVRTKTERRGNGIWGFRSGTL